MLRARRPVVALAFLASLTFANDTTADEATPNTTVVTMTGDPARLQMAVDERWVDVCTTPCNQSLQAGRIFRIRGGKGERDSKPFELERRDGRSRLEVHTGTMAGRIVGLVLISVGAVSLGAGQIMLVAYSLRGGWLEWGRVPPRPPSDETLLEGGLVASVGGLVLLCIGGALNANSRTTVEQGESKTDVRTPEWTFRLWTPAPPTVGWTFTF